MGGEGGGGCRAHGEDTWCGWKKWGPKNRRESRSPPLPDRCRPPIGRRFCRMGTPARSSFPGRPKRKPHPPGNRLEENPPLTTVAAHVGASHAAAGGVPDIPPTKLEALCARSAKKSCRRHFSSDFLPPAPAAVPAGAGWRGGRASWCLAQAWRFKVARAPSRVRFGRCLQTRPWCLAQTWLRGRPCPVAEFAGANAFQWRDSRCLAQTWLRGRPCPQPSSPRAMLADEAAVLGSNVASGSPVPRRRTLASAIHGLVSLRAACASPSGLR